MHENPYAPPQANCQLPNDFIDRVQRERLALEIRGFLAGDKTAFEDDGLVVKFRTSQDRTIQFVLEELELVYEEFPNCDSKTDWDFVQRLLLLLESNRTVEIQQEYHWRGSQLVAGVALSLYVWMAFHFQFWGWQLSLLAIPFSIIAYGIEATHTPPSRSSARVFLYPFTSFSELIAAYNSANGFRKIRFQKDKISSDASSDLMYGFATLISVPFVILFIALFCILSPLVLLILTFPTLDKYVRIIEPQSR